MLTVKWDRESFYLQLPAPSTPLRELRSLIAQLTHLETDGFKIIHSGAVMKDDNAPLSAYRLRPNASITIIAHTPLSEPLQLNQTPNLRTEQTVLSLIQAELANVRRDLTPGVEAFLVQQQPDQSPAVTPQFEEQEKEHTRLGELLLQSLLRLDGIIAEGDWEHARRERKAAVKEVQTLLDRLDERWAEIQKH
ncbi:hypothetical protein M378DRAFT_186283 [Amanita muscaria Koide BX008]|uniref:BAG domain-containing protein n=1 Tax=Amanita muscaria (strain Koide BX008) TaxID=946122 RepID=A0A0C2SRI3_AMAMK|nr:hypothetical protein M378DRAFT_186283 [Amanita muscaria Koide BX008]